MTQEYVIQRKGAVISEGENSFVPEEGLRAAEYRLIGNTPDAKASVILLCESRNPLSVVFLFKSNNYETHFSTENI